MRAVSLSGSLNGIDLHAIFALLQGTRQTGSLRVSHGRWGARVLFDRGRPVGASFGDARGLAALEALALALPHGRFEFVKDGAGGEHDLIGDPATIAAFLERLRALRQRLGLPRRLLDATPHQIESAFRGAGGIPLERHLLQTLGAADGRHTVEEIANLRGTAGAVVEVAALIEMGLLRLEPPRSPAWQWFAREGRSWLRPAALALLAVLLLSANAWHERRATLEPIPAVAAEVPESPAEGCGECGRESATTVRVPNALP